MLGLRKKQSVVHYLYQRQITIMPSPTKLCFKVLRRLIESPDSSYELIWKTRSQQPILCEDGKLYLNNYSTCLTLSGYKRLPCELYSLPKNNGLKRTVDAVVYSGPVYNFIDDKPECYKPFFISLSADNWLRSYDNFSGAMLQEVYIGSASRLKYQHCDWETYGRQLVLTSALNVVLRGEMTTRRKPRILATLAVFTVLPLQFVALLEIDREIFGENCNHVNVSEGMLVIGTGTTISGAIRLYNFSKVLEESIYESVQLNEPCSQLNGAVVGTYPAGVPLNCKIKEPPTALFEVNCFDHIVHFGGHPWCYVASPPRSEGVFQVRSVADDNIVQNGYLHYPSTHFEPDTITFLGDNSGRLIYKAPHELRVFALETPAEGEIAMIERNSLSFAGSRKNPDTEHERKDGRYPYRYRASHSRTFVVLCGKSVLADDLDEDTSLFALLGFDPCDAHCQGRILLFDNVSEAEVKRIELGRTLDDMNDYSLTIELDTLVIVEKNECKTFACYVYNLWRELPEKTERCTRRKKVKKGDVTDE